VSNHHCKITFAANTFFVEDLQSSNGLFLNGKKITQSPLQDKDVIVVGKHALQFIDDRADTKPLAMAAAAAAASTKPGGTMMMTPERQQELAAAAAAAAQKKPAVIRVVSGIVDKVEYELKTGSTIYIGKDRAAQIPIKGTGFFGSAPNNAAMIASRPAGHFLIPVKERYVLLNGTPLVLKELLRHGDVIQAGGTKLRFEDPDDVTSD
jgi:pSer/pThr/pTyr-binding forkhead associated (FHA) protein